VIGTAAARSNERTSQSRGGFSIRPSRSSRAHRSQSEMIEIYKQIALVAPSDSTVLVTGESGTGKGACREGHSSQQSGARDHSSLSIAAHSPRLFSKPSSSATRGQLHRAVSDKRGLFEEASGGTIFLDEIGETSSALQVKLLRALQEGEVRVSAAQRPFASTRECLLRPTGTLNARFTPDASERTSTIVSMWSH
jgi:DNA-binding NtrC family response regulator